MSNNKHKQTYSVSGWKGDLVRLHYRVFFYFTTRVLDRVLEYNRHYRYIEILPYSGLLSDRLLCSGIET